MTYYSESEESWRRASSLTSSYFEHESLTICTSVTFKCPCSALFFFMPVSWAMSLASSFMLCAVTFETTPVAVTVCPTCSASDTLLLRTSQVLPSFAVNLNSFALSPCVKHPVMVRVSDFPLLSDESSAITHTDAVHARTRHKSRYLIFVPPSEFPD